MEPGSIAGRQGRELGFPVAGQLQDPLTAWEVAEMARVAGWMRRLTRATQAGRDRSRAP